MINSNIKDVSTNIASIQARQKERDDIAEKIAEFLAGGGKIDVMETGQIGGQVSPVDSHKNNGLAI